MLTRVDRRGDGRHRRTHLKLGGSVLGPGRGGDRLEPAPLAHRSTHARAGAATRVLPGGLVGERPARARRRLARRGGLVARTDRGRFVSSGGERCRRREPAVARSHARHPIPHGQGAIGRRPVADATGVARLPEPSPDAAWWIAKAGPEHYAQHVPRLRAGSRSCGRLSGLSLAGRGRWRRRRGRGAALPADRLRCFVDRRGDGVTERVHGLG